MKITDDARDISDTWLRAFIVATRCDSFSAAADILGVGQPAVSHSVARLERAMGVRLFNRSAGGIVTTSHGAALFEKIAPSFADIDRAVELTRANRESPVVTLSVSTSLATYWLMPRLALYKREHPGVQLRVITRDSDSTVGQDDASLWIPLGSVDRPDLVSNFFCVEEVGAVAAPTLARKILKGGMSTMLTAPLLNLEERFATRFGWSTWFAHNYMQFDATRIAYQSNDYSIVLQAAIDGEGVAIGWTHLVADLIRSGKLVRIGDVIRTDNSFQIVHRRGFPMNDAALSVHAWLVQMGQATLEA